MSNIKYLELKKFFLSKNIKQYEIADLLGIDRSTFNSKLNSSSADFTLSEVRILCQKFNLDANKYFLFDLSVPNKEQSQKRWIWQTSKKKNAGWNEKKRKDNYVRWKNKNHS